MSESWWENGQPNERGASFVEVRVRGNQVLLAAGQDDYEVHGQVEITPDIAEQVAAWLIDAAKIAREGGRDDQA